MTLTANTGPAVRDSAAGTLDICADLDGCLYDFVAALRGWIHRSTGRPLDTMGEPQVWDFYRHQWGLDTTEFLEHYRDGVRAGHIFTHGAANPAGLAALRRLAGAGHRIHVITTRALPGIEDAATAATQAWLDREGVPYTTVSVVPGAKAQRAAELGCTIAYDDAPQVYDELDEAGATRPYLLDRAYNADHHGRRFHTWAGFEAAVARHAATAR